MVLLYSRRCQPLEKVTPPSTPNFDAFPMFQESPATTLAERLGSAVVVASPCTAPFMGASLGFALTQPMAIALTVFLALALEMASRA